jgi:ribosomal protein S18 acetylase RimI-like enzyme
MKADPITSSKCTTINNERDFAMKNILESGVLVNKSDKCKYSYRMVLLNHEHTQQILDLEHSVLDNLKDRDLCLERPLNIVQEALNDKGLVAGVFVGERLIGVRMLYFAGKSEYNLGRFAGLKDNELDQVVNMEFSAVHPDFRGNSLQRRMSEKVLDIARKSKNFHHICSMVSPKNFPSISEKFALNLYIANLTLVYGGHWRYIFHQNTADASSIRPDTVIEVLNTDYKKQVEIIEQGYYGFRMKKNHESMSILFGKVAV